MFTNMQKDERKTKIRQREDKLKNPAKFYKKRHRKTHKDEEIDNSIYEHNDGVAEMLSQ